ncbi:mitochondrial import inner membrane translocase subunit Tim21 [Pyxicephalus adspersus]|uniref:Mitochondrial import inner membrane translocase subunit Tim21 n=1 Tax=Pyxicephalus adspersus TaxID=30357 RepID=A0AAV3A9W9_PYXAD|nr:TPA: hypothetical protein GDO54_012110 [Pyxicephalus adspersus]
MVLPSCVWRGVLHKHSLLPYTLQCVMRVPGYRLACGSPVCLDSIRRRALGTPQMCVKSLCTGRYLLKLQNHPKYVQTPEDQPQTIYQRVSKAGLGITFVVVGVAGAAIIAAMIYYALKDLLCPLSPSKLFANALEKCQNHPEVIEMFGGPINSYGVFENQKREQNISAIQYVKNNVKCMLVKFNISGSEVKLATVKAYHKKNPVNGRYDIEYIIVETKTDPQMKIIIEDNRYDM